MLYLIVSLAIQVGLIVHVIRTGRNSLWIWAIALIPVAGPIAYIIAEVLPDLFRSRAARRATAAVRRSLDPERELRRYSSEVKISGNLDSRRRYAEELTSHGQFDAAIEAYRAALSGLYEHDPQLLLGLARAQFGKTDFAAARDTLDRLIKQNPDFKSADGHLLYARSLESEGDLDKALEEYRALATYYPGAEARVRHGQLLKRRGDADGAHRVFSELLDSAQLAPAHYRKAQREWLDLARREL
ncbi:MAG TPA: tetratricopeptide repeat protein [Steroidobacteraceae bacterium]|nr:tetratricopeptide repeat protein [Steroidobacteraceae bacterium]